MPHHNRAESSDDAGKPGRSIDPRPSHNSTIFWSIMPATPQQVYVAYPADPSPSDESTANRP